MVEERIEGGPHLSDLGGGIGLIRRHTLRDRYVTAVELLLGDARGGLCDVAQRAQPLPDDAGGGHAEQQHAADGRERDRPQHLFERQALARRRQPERPGRLTRSRVFQGVDAVRAKAWQRDSRQPAVDPVEGVEHALDLPIREGVAAKVLADDGARCARERAADHEQHAWRGVRGVELLDRRAVEQTDAEFWSEVGHRLAGAGVDLSVEHVVQQNARHDRDDDENSGDDREDDHHEARLQRHPVRARRRAARGIVLRRAVHHCGALIMYPTPRTVWIRGCSRPASIFLRR